VCGKTQSSDGANVIGRLNQDEKTLIAGMKRNLIF
jgi:hypothetical protein